MFEALAAGISSLPALTLLGGFLGVALWESFAPRTQLARPLTGRWLTNLALYALTAALLGLLAPAELVAATTIATHSPAKAVALVIGSVLAIDVAKYGLHRLSHAVPPLWRLHAIHHSDPELDATTALRHHPVESWLMTLALVAVALPLGVPPAAFLVHGVLSTLLAMLQHGNAAIPAWLERALAPVFVMSAMHRLHHSIEMAEGNSNFGTVFSWWDRLFGTYRGATPERHDRLRFGVDALDPAAQCRLPDVLITPFVRWRAPAPRRREAAATADIR